jgi:DnaK suppressor protein
VSLTPKSVQHYQEKLLEQKRLLQEATLTAVEQGRQATADETQDVADQAVLSYQKELLYTQGTNGSAQLRLVGRALQRIADGSFGECVQCGVEIGAKRLEALPWTPHCINCQEKIEKGELGDSGRAA